MNDDVLPLLREARFMLLREKDDGQGSREHSITITELDSAILWRQFDLQIKCPPVNKCGKAP